MNAVLLAVMLASTNTPESRVADAAWACSPTAVAMSRYTPLEFRFDPCAMLAAEQLGENTVLAGALQPLPEAAPAFAASGSWRLNVQGFVGMDIDRTSNVTGGAGVGLSHFIKDGLALVMELNGMYIGQAGDDAVAGNFNLLARWHFLRRDDWSLYVEGGAGLMLSSAEVPFRTATVRGGTNFNFTPQGGVGVTFDLGDEARGYVGARWMHISNANLYRDNPGRDNAVVYAGISRPF